jgi:transposase
MYLRHTTVKRNGKTRTYWRLVRSVRIGSKVRQETVAYLGELDDQGRLKAKALAQKIVGTERQPSLFEADVPDEPITLDLKRLRLERARRFGDVWLAWRLWQALSLDDLCARLLPKNGEHVPWAAMAAVLVIARFCAPSSELHIAEDWFRRTALDDLLGIPETKVNDDRLYRALDHILPHKDVLEKHLKDRLGTLFKLEYDLLLYDVTSTYFEGQAKRNKLAKRGYSRDHRPDCLQVCIGLVVTRDGYPLGYEVFEGNRHDSKTLREIVLRMEERYGQNQRIWALDRGMINDSNLAWLKERGSRYIVGTPKSLLAQMGQQLRKGPWEEVRDGLEVQLGPSPDENETYILCRSRDRAAKERAMLERFETRIEEGLQRMQVACSKKRCKVGVIERRVGRLLQRNSRAARIFDIKVEAAKRGSARLSWSKKSQEREKAQLRHGCYVLRSNVTGWTPTELWQAYMHLADAEAAFRIQKSDLVLRPIWHQKTERVQAHILVCFLAYVMRKTLEGWSVRAGLGNSLVTLLEELARIESNDVVFPTRDGRTVRLRCVVRPDRPQRLLLDRLGLDLPERIQIPKGLTDM